MARAAADNLGTHTMATLQVHEKQFVLTPQYDKRCTYSETTQEALERGWSPGNWVSARNALEALEIGETLVDEDGDTWERIA